MKFRTRHFLSALLLATVAACGGGGGGGGGAPSVAPPVSPPVPAGMLGDGTMALLVADIRQRNNVPALGAIILSDGLIADQAVDGLRSNDNTIRVTMEDQWHIGSMTKAMTATLAAILVEQSLITWDTTPADVWPGDFNTMQPQFQNVTLVQLLAHQAGLQEDVSSIPSINLIVDEASGTLFEKTELWARELLELAPANAVGGYRYTNAGYIIAGAMLQAVTGTPWETLMTDNIFGPLGMLNTAFGAPGTRNLVDQPLGHTVSNGRLVSIPVGPGADNPRSVGPAGTVHTTMADFALYMFAHLEGELGTPGLVSVASYQFLHTPVGIHTYALGWETDNSQAWSNGTVLVHNGSNTRWLSSVGLVPGLNVAVMIVTNAANADASNATDELAERLVERILASP